jgi:hypothetical protein
MTVSSRLFDRVCYVLRSPTPLKDVFGNEFTVSDTFPYDPKSKSSPHTAARWGKQSRWDQSTRTWHEFAEPTMIERNNEPFSVRITGLDVRSEGGRAYKVIDDDFRRFDLREDQLIEAFKHVGVEPGGKIPGKFVWGLLGSQTRLVFVGGDLHHKMVENTEALKVQKKNVVLMDRMLKFGHVYRKRDGFEYVFIGRVKIPGNDRTMTAMMQLPIKPQSYDHLNLDDDCSYNKQTLVRLRREREVSKNWDTMTIDERCRWDWYDSRAHFYEFYQNVKPGAYDKPGAITLSQSTKFEAEVDVEHPEQYVALAETLLANEGGLHPYCNGYGIDIAEEHWRVNMNDGVARKWQFDERALGLSCEAMKRRDDEVYAAANAAKIRYRVQFRDNLRWL